MKIKKMFVAAISCLLFVQVARAVNSLSLSCNGCRINYPSSLGLTAVLSADPAISGTVDVTLSVSSNGSVSPALLSVPMTVNTSSGMTTSAGSAVTTLTPFAAGMVTVIASAPGFPPATSVINFVAPPPPPVAPAAPSNLSASAASSNRINLNWTNNANNATGVLIERARGGGAFSQIASVGLVSSFSDTGLKRRTTYSYRVRATNAAGNSGYSNTATAKTLTH